MIIDVSFIILKLLFSPQIIFTKFQIQISINLFKKCVIKCEDNV